MTTITLTNEIARQLATASLPIVFVDSEGRKLAQVDQLEPEAAMPQVTPEFLAELQRRFENPGHYSTLQEIKERLGWTDK